MSLALRASTLGDQLRAFAVLAEKTARGRLAYRLATLISLLANGFAYSVVVLVWLQVYRENPEPGPFDRSSMLAYLVTAFVVNEILNLGVEMRFLQRVRMGLIATDVIRPLAFLPFQMAQAFGDVLVNLLFALPVLGVGLLFVGGAFLPPTVAAGVFGLLSLVLAFFVAFGLCYLNVQAAFVLVSGYGIFFARLSLHQVFSGLAAPLVMFPGALRSVAEWLPFRHVIATPISIWLGHVQGPEILGLLIEQATWGAALTLVGALIFGQALRRHQMQGG